MVVLVMGLFQGLDALNYLWTSSFLFITFNNYRKPAAGARFSCARNELGVPIFLFLDHAANKFYGQLD